MDIRFINVDINMNDSHRFMNNYLTINNNIPKKTLINKIRNYQQQKKARLHKRKQHYLPNYKSFPQLKQLKIKIKNVICAQLFRMRRSL